MCNEKNKECILCKNKNLYKKDCIIVFCKCNYCNHCHIGGFCPDHKFWFTSEYNDEERQSILPGQSHGGHGWIPECSNYHFD